MANDILGTSLANLLEDTAEAEIIRGMAGNDTLINLTNFDTLYGGDGDDSLRIWQPSAAFLHVVAFGDAGHDLIRMMPGCDAANIFAGYGDDTILGTGGRGYFTGGDGADVITGGGQNTWETNRLLAYGDNGQDILTAIWNAYGGNGNDLLVGSHIASGGNGRDTVGGTAGDDYLSDDGTDSSRNVFYGHSGRDSITGGRGIDRIEAGYQNDTAYGGSGNDVIYGGSGNDQLFGGSGHDRVWGDAGGDSLMGDSGNDTLYGGDSIDTLSGGLGRDVLWGGAGPDVFLFSAAAETGIGTVADAIQDFIPGGDRIKLAFGPLSFIGSDGFSNLAGEVRFDVALHRLQIDIDGNGAADAAIILVGVTDLTAGDLIL